MSRFAPEQGWSAWPAPAKLNLFLQITGRRPDGYHELQSVFRLLEWGDTVYLRLRQDGLVRRVGDSVPGLDEADDLMVRAANALQREGKSKHGADIGIEKRIPTGGGFGGGSSDAATVLRVLDRLWGTELGVDRLADLGLALGADVPVFVRGENAWAEGIGERLSPLVLAPAWYLVVDPGVHVPTSALFAAPDLTRNAAPAKISDFVSGHVSGNAFESVLRRREPAIQAAFERLSSVGTPRLTGSGSGCFVEFAQRDLAESALREMTGLRAWLAAGAARSPLLQALEAEMKS
ncbi:MAG TPA: 4-(cytidine 5'-diphospho)-2-C-methyl-D-erythritol kinase [Pseudoxanthomonas sp.]|jgi:4-diphosphocytidyl-2-C-methyl-D-erythritol kinase|nr:4-(cytidine 5'-diphospho)-2-C-methyl-D-erythritol kinase [Pseudoxanthomonas sp.]